jgi:hypothetical protein
MHCVYVRLIELTYVHSDTSLNICRPDVKVIIGPNLKKETTMFVGGFSTCVT